MSKVVNVFISSNIYDGFLSVSFFFFLFFTKLGLPPAGVLALKASLAFLKLCKVHLYATSMYDI